MASSWPSARAPSPTSSTIRRWEAVYPGEVTETVKALTGADRVAVMGWMFRCSGDLTKRQQHGASQMHRGGVQPPPPTYMWT